MKLASDRVALELRRARVPLMVLIGLTALAGLTGVVVLRKLTFQKPWEDYVDVRVAFPDVKGIAPGKHEVRVAGVPAGVVKSARIVDGTPVLTLAIRKQFAPVYRDARIRLRPVTPLQDMFVAIESRGTPAAGVARDNELLTRASATSPVDISRVLQVFDADTRVHMHALLDGLGKGLDGRGQDLRTAFAEFVPFLDQVRRLNVAVEDRREALAQVMHDVGGLTAALARRDRQLATLVSRGNATTAALAQNDRPFSATLAELPGTLDVLRRSMATLRAAEADLDPALVALQPVAEDLRGGLTALERFATEARPALAALRKPVDRLTPTARELTPALASLRSAVTRLQPQAPRINHLTKSFVPCQMAAQKFFHWTLSVFKFRDAFATWPRGDTTMGINTPGTASIVDDPGLQRTPNCMEGATR